jgi:putative protease
MTTEKQVGEVTHYFDHLGVAVFQLTGGIKVGDEIHIQGHTTDFTQKLTEMQIDHKPVEKVSKGAEIGVKVSEVVREGDKIYLV